ncbi:unnamed protein product [Didymodactylos carnosus]|uniref:Kinesin light chain n=1 Tax=Didymodactylos carnosus TaxID=1234261 RepID=A0A814T5W7_9BILA|nr:unnamed protein product [Didymodactylos carnosus]CAF3920512.1 unnamed protein product [Didymodactylos carnosus]
MYTYAYELRQKQLPEDHHYIDACLNNIGAIFKDKHEYAKALDCSQTALKIYDKNYPDDHASKAYILANIGLIYKGLTQYQLALEHLIRVQKMYQRLLPEEHPYIVSVLRRIGSVYEDQRDYNLCRSSKMKYFQVGLALLSLCAIQINSQTWTGHYTWHGSPCDNIQCCCGSGRMRITQPSSTTIAVVTGTSSSCGIPSITQTLSNVNGYRINQSSQLNMQPPGSNGTVVWTLSSDSKTITLASTKWLSICTDRATKVHN